MRTIAILALVTASLAGTVSLADACSTQQISAGCRTTYHNGHDPFELCSCPNSAAVLSDTSDKLILSIPRGSNPYSSLQQSLQTGFTGIHCARISPNTVSRQCCSVQNGKKTNCWEEEKFISMPQNLSNGPSPGTCTSRNCEWVDGSCYCGGANGRR